MIDISKLEAHAEKALSEILRSTPELDHLTRGRVDNIRTIIQSEMFGIICDLEIDARDQVNKHIQGVCKVVVNPGEHK